MDVQSDQRSRGVLLSLPEFRLLPARGQYRYSRLRRLSGPLHRFDTHHNLFESPKIAVSRMRIRRCVSRNEAGYMGRRKWEADVEPL